MDLRPLQAGLHFIDLLVRENPIHLAATLGAAASHPEATRGVGTDGSATAGRAGARRGEGCRGEEADDKAGG